MESTKKGGCGCGSSSRPKDSDDMKKKPMDGKSSSKTDKNKFFDPGVSFYFARCSDGNGFPFPVTCKRQILPRNKRRRLQGIIPIPEVPAFSIWNREKFFVSL